MGTNELCIGDVFTNAARAVPDRVAVALGERSLTFAAIDAGANQLAGALHSIGVGRGSRVVVWCDTALEIVPLFAALAKVGAVYIPVNGLLGPDEAMAVIGGCRPDLVITDVGRTAPAGSFVATTLGALAESAGAFDTRPAGSPDGSAVRGGDAHVAFFTSGSTGRPKGAVLSHGTNYLRSHAGALLEPRGAMVCPYPMFHMAAWTIALQQWQARDRVVLLGSTGAEEICEAVARHRATRLNAVPAVWRRILEHIAEAGHEQLSTIRFADTGTSSTPIELLTAIEAAVPAAHLRVFYGSTEAGSVACLEHADIRRKPASCGPPAPGVRVRRAEDGELWVTSPVLFDGYLDDPEATSTALVDGWYRTGDVAEEDDDGYLRIVGRVGELIRTGGEAVVPEEVEAVLATHPAVREVAVVGLPDPSFGQVVCAVVVVPAGASAPTLEVLRAHCAGRLAAFKQPRRLHVVALLPRTASTGQVQRRILVQQAVAQGLQNSVLTT